MSDYSIINRMSEQELREFALFAYTSYPTLLVTHGIRQAFFKNYPSKHPSYDPQGPYQIELNLEQK